MGQITENFAKLMIEAVDKGHNPPLTAWEKKQLALAWLDRDAALATQPQAPQGAETGWQPIETAPAMKTVLACNKLGYVGMAIKDNTGRWNHIGGPTHWMPAPAAPKTPEVRE